MQTRVVVLFETEKEYNSKWTLCFQYCRYLYGDGKQDMGYRFIWKTPEGKLQPARGQARIPSVKDAIELIEKAKEEGWGNYEK